MSDEPIRGGAHAPEGFLAVHLPRFDPAALPNPETAFQFLDRGWRPLLGVICGLGFAYNFVLAPAADRREVDEQKLWVLCTLALGLAGAKTVERNRIGAPTPAAG